MATPIAEYDPFAWVYNRYWGAGFHDQIMPALDQLVLSGLPKRAPILDLCCGDGRLTQKLIARGFRVTGIEASAEMLTFARERCRRARLLMADARNFRLESRFAAVVSTFDSLNHILKAPDLKKVFTNVRRCLEPEGLFVFDLNDESAYKDRWASTSSIVDDDVVSIAHGRYYPLRRLATCSVTLMKKDNGHWTRSDFELVQRFYPQRRVMALLEAAGFMAEVHQAARVGMDGDFGYGRQIYVARPAPSESL